MTPSSRTGHATAHANIALAKYWGKADIELNMPAVPSLSLTLDALRTETKVCFTGSLASDEVSLDDQPISGRPKQRIIELLDRVRAEARIQSHARVQSRNNFPTAAGLASSASGFAALASAARVAAGLPHDPAKASSMARRSSASAARSLFGGFAVLPLNEESAQPLIAPPSFRPALIVAVTASGPKAIGSTEAMEHTRKTSPYYQAWLDSSPGLYQAMIDAVEGGALEVLGPLVEQSCLMMHASMLAAAPAVAYWRPASVSAMQTVRNLRSEGIPAFFTMDAGPHVKVLTSEDHVPVVEAALNRTDGVSRLITCRAGPDASVEVE